MPRIKGHYREESFAARLIHSITSMSFSFKLEYFQANNANLNNMCIILILRYFYDQLSFQDFLPQKNQKRIQCFGHILNFVAKTMIEGDKHSFLHYL